MIQNTVRILRNDREADLYYRLTLRAPRVAPLIQPGGCALRIGFLGEALLRRPFSVFQVADETFSILYKTVGKGTEALARMRRETT